MGRETHLLYGTISFQSPYQGPMVLWSLPGHNLGCSCPWQQQAQVVDGIFNRNQVAQEVAQSGDLHLQNL